MLASYTKAELNLNASNKTLLQKIKILVIKALMKAVQHISTKAVHLFKRHLWFLLWGMFLCYAVNLCSYLSYIMLLS